MVIFERRRPDHFVDIRKGVVEHRPVPDQRGILDRYRPKQVIARQYDPGAGAAGGIGNTCQAKAAGRVVDGVVGDQDGRGAGLKAQLRDGGDDRRMRGCRQLGRGCKGGIDFQQHAIAFFYECFHTAQGF